MRCSAVWQLSGPVPLTGASEKVSIGFRTDSVHGHIVALLWDPKYQWPQLADVKHLQVAALLPPIQS